MAFIGGILQEVLKIKRRLGKRRTPYDYRLQEKMLKKLVVKAKNTQLGRAYNFKDILSSSNLKEAFQKHVPISDYDSIYNQWWSKTLAGEENVIWPDKTKFFALTSGTTGASSKRVPITKDMIKSMRKVSVRQLLSIPDLNLNTDFYQKQILMLGGSTTLTHNNTGGFEGDLTGILQSHLPKWIQPFYKPGKQLASEKDWAKKLELVAKDAINWDIGIACGIPAWYQLLFEEIKRQHKVKHIHEVWPNFNIFIHGGVSFAPYRESFKTYLGKEINYLDTYLASEGFFAFQKANKQGMELSLDASIFYEFVPFNSENFTADGNLKPNIKPIFIEEVQENVDYALIISTCAGAWRYLIGDTIKFVSLKDYEIIISGRTKHFLSLCGEHLSVDNMNSAVKRLNEELELNINEFTVCGEPHKGLFAHKWYLGTNTPIDQDKIQAALDKVLCELNDDYATERKHALKYLLVEQIPVEAFYAFMKMKGKLGGQNKFPRVIKGEYAKEWEAFLSSIKTEHLKLL